MRIDYTRYYNKWHPNTTEHQEYMNSYYRRVLGARLPDDRNARILDVGCGSGMALAALRKMGYSRLSGVEFSPEQADAARKKGFEVTQTEDTVGFLRGRRGEFDLVLALDVLEHIPAPGQLDFVAAICGSLCPQGRLLCTVPNANSVLASRWRYNDWTHHFSFTEHSLDFLLYNAGFDPISVHPAEFHERPRLWWLPVGGSRHWWALRFFRFWRRLEMMAELGPEQGRSVPLSLNLLAVAVKK